MRWCVVLLASAIMVPTAFGQPSADKVEAEWKALQGEWSIARIKEKGGGPSADDLKDLTIVFKGRRMLSRHKDGEAEAEATLDPTKQPKWIDTKDKEFGDVMQGIYELNGDTLK